MEELTLFLMTKFGEYTWLILNLFVTTVCGIGIFVVFYVTRRKISISRGFAYTLIMLPPISAMIAFMISGDIVLAVGMLGALSIIRFRHSMKETENLMFVFWAVTAGLCGGFGYRMLPIILCLILGTVALMVYFVSEKRHRAILTVKTNGSTKHIENILDEMSIKFNLRYKNTGETSDNLYEIKYKKPFNSMYSEICERIIQLDDVSGVKLIEM